MRYQCEDIFWKLVGGHLIKQGIGTGGIFGKLVGGYLLKQGIGTGGMDWRVVNIGVIREAIGVDEISLEHSRKNIY